MLFVEDPFGFFGGGGVLHQRLEVLGVVCGKPQATARAQLEIDHERQWPRLWSLSLFLMDDVDNNENKNDALEEKKKAIKLLFSVNNNVDAANNRDDMSNTLSDLGVAADLIKLK